jgi:hypothetical protein
MLISSNLATFLGYMNVSHVETIRCKSLNNSQVASQEIGLINVHDTDMAKCLVHYLQVH